MAGVLELGILLGPFQRKRFCDSDSENHNNTHPLAPGEEQPWERCSGATSRANQTSHPVPSALLWPLLAKVAVPVFCCVVEAELWLCGEALHAWAPQALRGCSGTETPRLPLPISLHTSESTVSSSGARAEGILQERFSTWLRFS